MIGTASVFVAAFDTPDAWTDVTCLLDSVTVTHGRDNPESQPEPASATLEIGYRTDDYVFPATLDVGAWVSVVVSLAGTAYTRFMGTVTDIGLGWDEAGEATPDSVSGQVIAMARMARLGNTVVGAEPWPVELDGARVSRILGLGGMAPPPAILDPGTARILARDVDAQPALDLARAVATDADGVLWHTRDGLTTYADAEHRRNLTPVLSLDACDLLVTPQWHRSTEGLVNDISLGYGVAPEGGEQPRYAASNAPSIAKWGRADVSAATQLADLAAAQSVGGLTLIRNAEPVWVMAALPVAMRDLDQARTAVLLAADMHALVNLTGLPSAGTAPTSAALWLEGWRETFTAGAHDLELWVSGYCRSAPPPRWDDVPPAVTWDQFGATFDPVTTWDGAACMGPLPSFGRWTDVPASLRWDAVPPAQTWDEWKG